MRVIGLVILFTTAFYYFAPQEDANEIDILKVKVSAPKRVIKREAHRPATIERPTPAEEVQTSEESDSYQERVVGYTINDESLEGPAEVEFYEEDEAQEDELEAGWKHELRESLAILEPDLAEGMYTAYEAERSAYQADFDYLIKKHQQNADLEFMLNDLELRHEERLKEIFGRHYEEIRALQSSYIEYRTSSN